MFGNRREAGGRGGRDHHGEAGRRGGGHHRRHHPEGEGEGRGRRPHGGMHGGPHGGPHGRPGRGGWRRGGERLERGTLRPILLDTLRDSPRHGYDIIKAFEERSHGQYAPSPGAVYPTLQYLEDLGLVRSGQEGERRVYELTDAGRAELDAQADRVQAFWAEFGTGGPSEAVQHDVRFLKEDVEDLTRTIWGGLRRAVSSGDQETIRRIRRAVQQSQEEIRGIIAGAVSGGAASESGGSESGGSESGGSESGGSESAASKE